MATVFLRSAVRRCTHLPTVRPALWAERLAPFQWKEATHTIQQQTQFSSTANSQPNVRRYGMMIRLRPEYEEEYIRYHAAVWPEVLQTIRDCNISNYSIFLRDGVLFGYFEYSGEDLKADMAKMGECPETQKWWKVMKPMQQPVDNLKEDEDWWAMLEEVFHTD